MKKLSLLFGFIFALSGTYVHGQTESVDTLQLKRGEDIYLTFELSEDVVLRPVQFKNRYGVSIAAHLYYSVDLDMSDEHSALIIGTPYGGVKEQGAGVYAQEMAKRGYIALAFDESFNGESGGTPKDVSSPDFFVEDFSAAVDYLGTREFVDRDQIGVIGICGSGGFALTAAQVDPRIKAIATASMYDISSMHRYGLELDVTDKDRSKTLEDLAEQRWDDFEEGEPAMPRFGWPDEPADHAPAILPDVIEEFYEYYGTKRGWHPHTLDNFTLTSAASFMNFPLMSYVETISPRPILFIMGENAHSRRYTEEVYERADEPKELVIVPNARHIDLYDRVDLIPFEKLDTFFKENLD